MTRTSYDKRVDKLLNRRTISLLVLFVVIVIGIGSFTDALTSIKTFCRSLFESEQSYWPLNPGYQRYRNDRFGFAFQYPDIWLNNIGPTNGDGQKIFHPNDNRIFMVGSGSHFPNAYFVKDSVINQRLTDLYVNDEAFAQYEHFLSSELVGSPITQDKFVKEITYNDPDQYLFGYRVYETFDSTSNEIIWNKDIYTAVNGKAYTLRCRAPKVQLTDALQDIFNEAIKTFEIHEGLD